MTRQVSYLLAALLLFFIVAVPLEYASCVHAHWRNFHVVKEGVLYRSGQLTLGGLKRVLHDYGIRTIITLRDAYDPSEPPPDYDEEAYCKKHDVVYVRISPKKWWTASGFVPADESVRTFESVMDDPANQPVLIHCFAGIHRTGAFCALYRMEYEGWPNDRAIHEVRDMGYTNLDDELDILSYLEEYRPRWWRSASALSNPSQHAALSEGDAKGRR